MTMENRVRDAFGTAAGTLDEMPPLELPRARHASRSRWAVPLAVATASAVIVAGMAIATGRTALPAPGVRPLGGFSIGPSLRPTGPPKFIVAATTAIMHDAHGPDWKSKITYTAVQPVVLDATTGRLLHTIPLPHGLWSSWQLAAAAPDNRTFVLSAVTVQPDPSPTASTTAQNPPIRFFQVHLDEQGQPGNPVLLPGSASNGLGPAEAVALSPDGRRLAYLDSNGLTVVDVRTGLQRTWTARRADMAASVSWMSDGRQVAIVTQFPSPAALRILDITGSGSDLFATSRSIPIPGQGPLSSADSAAVSPDGGFLIVAMDHSSAISPDQSWTEIIRISLNGTAAPRTLSRLPAGQVGAGNLTLDGTRLHLLYTRGWNIHRLDLTTGRASTFAVPSGARQGKGDAPGLAW